MQLVPQVFVSATSSDLASYRQAVCEALETHRILPIEQRRFPPDSCDVREVLRKAIRSCDAVICLIGRAYGGEPSNRAAGEPRHSFTQIEYEIARELGKPVFVFLASDDCAFDSDPRPPDGDADAQAKWDLQAAYRTAFQSNDDDQRWFTSHDQLKHLVAAIEFDKPGSAQRHVANLPYPSLEEKFKGRDGVLRLIRDDLTEYPPGTPRPITPKSKCLVLYGTGGVGKTRLAIEYGWRHFNDYTALLFVPADSPDNLDRGIAELAEPLDLPEQKLPEIDVRRAAVVRWLSEHPGWLLIIDNVDNQDAASAVDRLLPKVCCGHILITSKIAKWQPELHPIEIDILQEADACEFLLDRTPGRLRQETDAADVRNLAEAMGGLVLALEQAAGLIDEQELSFREYLKLWFAGKKRTREWLNSTVTRHPASIAVVWETTMRAVSPAAAKLYELLATFAAAPIPTSVLNSPVAGACLSKLVADADIASALAELVRISLAKRTAVAGIPCVSVHRVLRELTRDHIEPAGRDQLILAAQAMIASCAPDDAYRYDVWKTWSLLCEHAEAVWQAVSTMDNLLWDAALLKGLALYYLGQDRCPDAAPIQEHLVKLLTTRKGYDHPDTLLARNDLALILFNIGQIEEPRKIYCEVIEAREKAGDKTSVAAGETLFNLAELLVSNRDGNLRKPDEAIVLLKKAIEIHSLYLPESAWRVLMEQMTLAKAHFAKGEDEVGESLLRENIAEKRLLLTKDVPAGGLHPDTLNSLMLLATYIFAKGTEAARSEAEIMLQEAMEASAKTLGEEHPKTIRIINDLAIMAQLRGDMPAALKFYERLLLAEGRLLDESSQAFQNYARGLNNLSFEMRKLGMFAEAEPLLRKALDIDSRNRSPDDPKIAHRLMNLSTVLVLQNKLAEAKVMLSQAWAVMKGQPDVTTAKLLLLRAAVAALEDGDANPYLGRLKSLLDGQPLSNVADALHPWDAEYLTDGLDRLRVDAARGLFAAIIQVINDPAAGTDLAQYPEWIRQDPIPLSAAWPTN